MYDYFGNCMMGYGWGGLGVVMAIIWWLVIIALVILLVRWLAGRAHYRPMWRGEKSAREILEERYAKGEINKEEFEAKKKDLEK